jgi:translation initiation factor IF-1
LTFVLKHKNEWIVLYILGRERKKIKFLEGDIVEPK